MITSIPGIITIDRAPLTVTADARTKVYGQANPALTSTISGFVRRQPGVADHPIHVRHPGYRRRELI